MNIAVVAQVVVALGTIFAVWINLRDRQDRNKPFLTVEDLNFDGKRNTTFMRNVGSGPALNLVVLHRSTCEFIDEGVEITTPAHLNGQPALADVGLQSHWFALALRESLKLAGEDEPVPGGQNSVHIATDIKLRYEDNGGRQYFQSIEIKAAGLVAAMGPEYVPHLMRVHLKSAHLGPQHHLSVWSLLSRHVREFRRDFESAQRDFDARVESREAKARESRANRKAKRRPVLPDLLEDGTPRNKDKANFEETCEVDESDEGRLQIETESDN